MDVGVEYLTFDFIFVLLVLLERCIRPFRLMGMRIATFQVKRALELSCLHHGGRGCWVSDPAGNRCGSGG